MYRIKPLLRKKKKRMLDWITHAPVGDQGEKQLKSTPQSWTNNKMMMTMLGRPLPEEEEEEEEEEDDDDDEDEDDDDEEEEEEEE